MTADLAAWSDFNVAIVGAAAALAGLVIVAASVNIREVIQATTVTARLGAGIVALVVALSIAAIGLIPDLDTGAYGVIILTLTLIAAVFQAHAARVIVRTPPPGDDTPPMVTKAVVGFVPIAAYAVAGFALLVGHPAGLYASAAAALLTIASALLVSWIALVEVLR
ncbi:hypothetical protein QSU92_03295 [Microbacterium sp. ET2]|uniref:hypothetical protein n=1 Tax=Microbacterium albipurpureum TaxID=3050384 RepID=UPI00259C6EE4|nr:hypothetical protein [Microbacterium sp. ET2 (Ac-2212)]WJL96238.1 hypothetical protein QSU92_03295 [Microbacterium sp. ET2 (Ac-2212)]